MSYTMDTFLQQKLQEIEAEGLYKKERIIGGPQHAQVKLQDGQQVLNLCANNYLGLSNHPEIVRAAQEGMEQWGFGLSSVRFICGTQTIHKELEHKLSKFLGMDDTILYSSCYDANGGLFETLLGPEDAVISDALNHASIIDGIRLCKAKRFRYQNSDMADLEAKLIESADCRFRLIVTDGVFSMDGFIAKLKEICDLADRYDAMVMVDDSHAVGFMGKQGRGTHEHCDVMERIDIITGTLGKALGGASGGYTSARQEIIDLLRQHSRPYLFSNSLAPSIVCASLKTLELLNATTELRDRLQANTSYFREKIADIGLEVLPGSHPIVPVMFGDAKLTQQVSTRLLEQGVYAIGFFYPVVPKGTARIRTQMSAAHTREDLDIAIKAFQNIKLEFKL